MSEQFDPYHRWLGIAPEEQPANHYRLLGLKQFEADADVIESAADRQMAHVRGFQSGKHADDAQRVLNEIAAAKLVLLKPDEKANYDAQLNAQQTPPKRVREPKMAQALPPESATASFPPPKRPTPKSVAASGAGQTSAGPNLVLLAAVPLLILVALVGGVLAYFIIPWGEGDAIARNDGGNNLTEVVAPPPTVTPSNNPNPNPNTNHDPEPEPGGTTPVGGNAANQPSDRVDPGPLIPLEKIEPVDPDDGELVALAPEAQPPVANGPKKHPVPGKAARDAARTKIDGIFSIADADTRAKKAALAQQLLKVAGETKEDSVAQFVLLNMARELAAENAQARLAMQAVDQLQANFDFDTSAVRMATLGAAVKSPVAPTEKHEVLAVGIEMIDAQMQRDEYEAAGTLAVALLEIGRRARKEQLLDALIERRSRAAELLTAYTQAKAAIETLKTDPDNADANLIAGRFHLVAKSDWGRALPLLAKGSDEKFAAASKAEIQKPSNTEQQEKLANAWWVIAEAEADKSAQHLLQSRAMAWYQRAAPNLNGLAKAAAQQRLKQLADAGIRPGDLTFSSSGSIDRIVADGLVAHWTFDEGRGETARDDVGGNHGTIKGAKWTAGVLGGGLAFDGDDDKVQIGAAKGLSFKGEITLSAWVRPKSLPAKTEPRHVVLHTADGGLVRLFLGNQSRPFYGGGRLHKGSKDPARSPIPGDDLNTWVHLATIFDGQSWTLYRNGTAVASSRQHIGADLPSPSSWLIGRGFHGDIDEVRIYNRALTAKEVKTLATPPNDRQSRSPPIRRDASLVAHWTFDEGRGAVARDSVGGHHGTIKGGTWIRGVRGNALSFDGTDDTIEIPLADALNINGRITLSAWVRARSLRTKQDQHNSFTSIIDQADKDGATFLRYIDQGEGPKYSTGAYQPGKHTHQALSTVANTDVGQWVHLVGVYDGAAWRLYRNGRQVASQQTDLSARGRPVNWRIGGPGAPDRPHFFHGDIDDVRIYNRALSAEEVTVLAKPN